MVYLNSLLPNPDGPDAGNEWVGLTNDSSEAVSLDGWHIEDNGGAAFYFSGFWLIQPAENAKVLPTGVTLNNNGDKIILYDNQGTEVDSLEYGDTVAEGEIIFSPKTRINSQIGEAAPLANVLEAGVVSSSSLISNTLQPALLGLFTAVLGTAVFAYVWRKTRNEHE